jgi:hypothetical protein
MSRRSPYRAANQGQFIAWLDRNKIEYVELNHGSQIRVWGATRLVDIWPARMIYHIIESEDVIPSHMQGYQHLSPQFHEKEVKELLQCDLA